MSYDSNSNSEFYCMKLNEHVTAMNCKNGIAGKGPAACIDCVTGRERAAKVLDFNKGRSKNVKVGKKSKKEKTDSTKNNDAITVKSFGDIKSENAESLKPEMKRCCRCKQYKLLDEFAKNKNTPDGFQWHCRECGREYELKKKHKRLHNKNKIYLDFANHPELFEKVNKFAKDNFRGVSEQIFYMIKTWIDIDSKYEKAKKIAVAKSLRNLEAEAK